MVVGQNAVHHARLHWATMDAADIVGDHATPKGLRHGFGVCMAMQARNPSLVQKLLGHSNLETTAIYMDLVGDETRAEFVGAWLYNPTRYRIRSAKLRNRNLSSLTFFFAWGVVDVLKRGGRGKAPPPLDADA